MTCGTNFGLDKPLTTQLALYVGHVAIGDLGYSDRQRLPVAELIAERLPATLLLTGTAMAFALAAGVALGALAARRVDARRHRDNRTGADRVRHAEFLAWADGAAAVLDRNRWSPLFGMTT